MASFVTSDAVTQGAWTTAYGGDGFSLAGGPAALPKYAQTSLIDNSSWTWATSTNDARALQKPGSTDRLAACWYSVSFTIDVKVTDGRVHQAALYLLDWDGGGSRSERIDALDANNGRILDSRTVSAFQGGQYLVWNVSGHVRFRVSNISGLNSVVSGLFFGGPVPTPNVIETIVTPYDAIPHFGARPTITATRSGNWSDAGTWSAGRLPAAGDVVAIGDGKVVTYDLVSDVPVQTVAILSGGSLRFRSDVNTRLTVTNLEVLQGGELQIGTATTPVAPNVKAEVIFPDQPFDLALDPLNWGHGLVALGKVTIHGAVNANPFIRLAAEPLAGQTTLTLSQPATDWKVGDKLILPDTRQLNDATRGTNYTPQWEVLTIAGISADGLRFTLTTPLQYSHPGARNATSGALEFLPHVNNTTRNVIIRSANSQGTRGHVVFTYRADVDVRYATFGGLGRTTLSDIRQPGFTADRNPVQFRHLFGPAAVPPNGYQYTFVGNVVTCPLTPMTFVWGINVNDSDYGLVRDNILYNWAGASLVTKTGTESYNVIAHNSVVRTSGTAERIDDFAAAGTGFWLRGPNNYVRDNVAADINAAGTDFYSYGFNVYARYLGSVTIPAYQGADPSVAGQSRIVDMNATPLLQFSGNEVYGASQNGVTVWWLGAYFETPKGPAGTVQDLRVWHQSGWGFYGYETNQLVVDGYTARGDVSKLSNPFEGVTGMWFADYMTRQLVIRNADIQGMAVGIMTPTNVGRGTVADTTVIRDSYLRNTTNIRVTPPRSVNGSTGLAPKTLNITNVRFAPPRVSPGWNYNIQLDYVASDSLGTSNFAIADLINVTNYDAVAGDNFQVFYNESRPADAVTRAGIYGYVKPA